MSSLTRPSIAQLQEQFRIVDALLTAKPGDPGYDELYEDERLRLTGIAKALFWVLRGGPSPWTRRVYRILDEQAIDSEAWEAYRAEEQMRRDLDRGSVVPGSVNLALEYVLGRCDDLEID